MKRRLFLAAIAMAPAAPPAPAHAHEPRKGPHGGVLVDAGAYHVEIVTKGTTVDVYVSDGADKPLPAAGFRATAILAIGGKPQRIALGPAEGNRLTGQAGLAVSGPPKGAVLLTAPDGKTAQARID